MNSRGFALRAAPGALSDVRRCLAAALALWMTVISIGVHGAHTCTAVSQPCVGVRPLCGCLSPYCQNAAFYGLRACAPCSNPWCACRSLRFAQASRGDAAIRPVLALEKNDGCCLACKYLAPSQSPAVAVAPLLFAGCFCDAAIDRTAINLASPAAYSPGAPRAPPTSPA